MPICQLYLSFAVYFLLLLIFYVFCSFVCICMFVIFSLPYMMNKDEYIYIYIYKYIMFITKFAIFIYLNLQ